MRSTSLTIQLTNMHLATKLIFTILIALSAFMSASLAAFATPKTCESLAQLSLPNTKITAAQSVTTGEFTPPGRTTGIKNLPAFCRVSAALTPSADSDIKIEVWFPLSGWNGKYRGQGNGGFAGAISFDAMAAAIKLGYATAGTDTGHTGNDAAWALGHPEKVVDFGWRGIHEMTLKAKAIIQDFYGESPKQSYFSSCSDGGREALMEAQRFPTDYEGIIAGAPANYWSRLLTAGMLMQAVTLNGDSYIPASKLPAITAAAMTACDAQDGVKDGLLTDPRQCRFDPAVLICKNGDSDSCLTEPQARALKEIYTGVPQSGGGLYFPGYLPGSEESGWNTWITGPQPGRSVGFFFGTQFFTNMIYGKDWNYHTFNFAEASKLAETRTAAALDSTDPNLKAFKSRGGKLIIYHGWNDPAIPALNTINYFDSVLARLGRRDSDAFMRLFMVPGMGHCGGGPGPNSFGQGGSPFADDPEHNIYRALEQWVERGVAPERLTAVKYNDDRNPAQGVKMTRPLCAYPQVAKYKGSGDSNDAANFVCAPAEK
ncbi:MAG TPA: tannase/feruloyl esterase family alpha/beta hydrolase [Pyrinomonadaceae bacterium]|nr:tannase/feruloyl esterase family alpha/beta hydrolase [Pyrinomonadaceae bacterium]